MVAISASDKDGSSLNLPTPTLRSMCQGGITRVTTFSLMDRAQGRASLYVRSAIGAIDPGRWQFWQDRCRIGAMSLEKVTSLGGLSAASAANGSRHTIDPNASAEILFICDLLGS